MVVITAAQNFYHEQKKAGTSHQMSTYQIKALNEIITIGFHVTSYTNFLNRKYITGARDDVFCSTYCDFWQERIRTGG